MGVVEVVEAVGTAIEVAGVAVIAVGTAAATAAFLYRFAHRTPLAEIYRSYRHGVGRAILLGLEFLVAGDIIRTVAIEPSFRSVGVLAGIVLIRTFLSFSLEVELENRWPWQRPRTAAERST
ncbi:DUF1622 domain-containing protein [Nocardiopsis quinghaiensis]|uniref:DUF1622 domain-containing protein n=1 Tax=Nocardiopsis quinghaiensis TaxID=464995 RepID=UPI001239381E|nr:DUF1622 domain-containing protein [Nocardiopsis quinghaiensis]